MIKKKKLFEEITDNLRSNKIPKVDLHMHTNWTDGKNTVSEMYKSACSKGLDVVLYSEHARYKSVDWFKNFAQEVRSIKKKKCLPLVGVESKILNYKGEIDIHPKIARECDLIMGSVHRFPGEDGINLKRHISKYKKKEAIEIEFELSIAALKYSSIDILGHPFGMSYSRFKTQPPWKLIIELIKTAKKYKKAFEINSKYHKQAKKMISKCLEYETLISLGSNAHSVKEVGKIQKILS